MSAALDRLLLSMIAEPGDAVLARVVADRGIAAVAAAVRGSSDDLRDIDPRWRRSGADLDPAAVLAAARADGLRWVVPGDAEWPTGLDDLGAVEPVGPGGGAPLGIWARGSGHLARLADRSVAVVGARACTTYGAEVAAELGADLADRGWTVVSGAAYGIDACAHRGALSLGQPSIAVLAGGVDIDYPQGHAALLRRIADDGVIVSEQPPGAPTRPHRFLARNRLIAALARGTVVVEAARRSGSLNTLRWADRLGRCSLAVPGPVVSQQSLGTHEALRDGVAVLVTGVDDVETELASVGWSVVG